MVLDSLTVVVLDSAVEPVHLLVQVLVRLPLQKSSMVLNVLGLPHPSEGSPGAAPPSAPVTARTYLPNLDTDICTCIRMDRPFFYRHMIVLLKTMILLLSIFHLGSLIRMLLRLLRPPNEKFIQLMIFRSKSLGTACGINLVLNRFLPNTLTSHRILQYKDWSSLYKTSDKYTDRPRDHELMS